MLLEAYGITECSPMISGNRPGAIRAGSIGRPIDGYEILIVHPEPMRPVAPGEAGMLLVRGPSVFHGYLNYDGPSPMVECEGKTWYRTGDLVAADAEGNLYFRGRLKRFLKAGGEMISLPALEEPFSKRYPPGKMAPWWPSRELNCPKAAISCSLRPSRSPCGRRMPCWVRPAFAA